MSKELVVIDDGKEVQWYDPIEPDEVIEGEDAWSFNNTYYDYTVEKKPGRTILIRDRVEEY